MPDKVAQRDELVTIATGGLPSLKGSDMLLLGDLQRAPLPKRFAIHALANLDAAITLTRNLIDRSAGATFADGAVTLSLAYHSVELFLKGAILFARPGESFSAEGHDLDKLERKYLDVYPEEPFRFEMPFSIKVAQLVDPDPDLERALIEQSTSLRKRMPQDQFLRYPADRKGVVWEEVAQVMWSYEPVRFLSTLERLRADYVRIDVLLQQTRTSHGDGGVN